MFFVGLKNIIPLWWMVLWKQKIHHRGGEGLEVSHMTVEERNKFKGQTFHIYTKRLFSKLQINCEHTILF